MNSVCVYFCIVLIVSLSSVTYEFETEIPDERKCSTGLVPYQITTSYGLKIICAYISPARLTWDDAKLRCNLLFSQLSQQIHFKSLLRTNLSKKGIDILWIGIRRQNNFFVTEYPSKIFREADSFSPDYWGYHWFDGEPGIEECVALNISNGSLQTRNCEDILSFVCDDDGKEFSTTHKNISCPEGWNLSFSLSSSSRTCISLHQRHTYEDAKEICDKNDAELADLKEYTILATSKTFSPSDAENFWIKKRNFELCEVIRIMNGHRSTPAPLSCILKFSFVCVKHYQIESVRVNLSPKSMKPVTSDSKEAADLIACDVETEFSESNMENDLWIQWYKDDLPIPFNSHVIRLSFIGDVLKRDPYILDIASRQGYFHCEVQLPGSNEKHFSSKMKFFYSDIATYFVEIHGIKQTNDFDYSHERFYDYMDDFEEASMNNVFEKIKSHYPEVEWDFKSKSSLNGEAIMKIVVYIYKSGTEDFDERMACEELKDAFEGLYSVPVFTENMSVYINCEEFPIRNGYIQVIKKLQNIEEKLNHMEEKQEYISNKLQNCERSRNIEIEEKDNDLDIERFLSALEDLKSIGEDLLHNTRNSDEKHKQREKNEFEDTIFSLMGERILDESKELYRSRSRASHSKSIGSAKERNENYISYPEKAKYKTASNRVGLERDL